MGSGRVGGHKRRRCRWWCYRGEVCVISWGNRGPGRRGAIESGQVGEMVGCEKHARGEKNTLDEWVVVVGVGYVVDTKRLHIKINETTPALGRSWGWLSAGGHVGGR